MAEADPPPDREPDLVVDRSPVVVGGALRDRAPSPRTRSTSPRAGRSSCGSSRPTSIHDFWVPAARRAKMDAMPGHPNFFWMQADAPGDYGGACAEYCGSAARVDAHRWSSPRRPRSSTRGTAPAAARPGSTAPSPAPRAASASSANEACVNCHAIRGAASSARVGARPHAPRRRAARSGPASSEDTRRARAWLRDPQIDQAGLPHAGLQARRRRGRRPRHLPRDAAMTRPRSPCPSPGARAAPRREGLRLGRRPSITSASASSTSSTALFFFCVGGCEALLIRLQLARPNGTLALARRVQPDLHDARHDDDLPRRDARRWSGFANYLVPLMIGARDMAFPRLNAIGYWLFPFGGLSCTSACSPAARPTAGWFSYAPLSETPFTARRTGTDYWVVALARARHRLDRRGDQPHRDHRHPARARA